MYTTVSTQYCRNNVLLKLLMIFSLTSYLSGGPYTSLEEHSPFVSPEFLRRVESRSQPPPRPVTPPTPNTLGREITLKAILNLGETTYFTFHDIRAEGLNKTYMLPVGGKSPRFEVVSYNESNQSVLVSANGQSASISISSPTFGATPPQPQIRNAQRPPSSAQNNTGTSASNNNNLRVIPSRRVVLPSVRTTNANNSQSTSSSSSSGGRGIATTLGGNPLPDSGSGSSNTNVNSTNNASKANDDESSNNEVVRRRVVRRRFTTSN